VGSVLLSRVWAGSPRTKLFLVLPVDATPDTRELEYNEIKTQVGLATGRLGLRRTALQQSFPQMLHQVGSSASTQPGSRPIEASSSASPWKKEVSFQGNLECVSSLHPSAVGCLPSEEGAGCGYSGSPIVLAIFPNPFHLERTGPLPPGKLLPWRTVSSDVSVSTGFGGETLGAS
jgi:hypothetical protein